MSTLDLNVGNWNKLKSISSESVFAEAKYYLEAAQILDDQKKGEGLFPPALTNAFFACELFSKAILYNKNGGEIINDHNLYNLYDKFPPEIKEALLSELNMDIDRLKRFICDISNAFEKWRYRFEYDKNNCHYSFAFDYANALGKICDNYLRKAKNAD